MQGVGVEANGGAAEPQESRVKSEGRLDYPDLLDYPDYPEVKRLADCWATGGWRRKSQEGRVKGDGLLDSCRGVRSMLRTGGRIRYHGATRKGYFLQTRAKTLSHHRTDPLRFARGEVMTKD